MSNEKSARGTLTAQDIALALNSPAPTIIKTQMAMLIKVAIIELFEALSAQSQAVFKMLLKANQEMDEATTAMRRKQSILQPIVPPATMLPQLSSGINIDALFEKLGNSFGIFSTQIARFIEEHKEQVSAAFSEVTQCLSNTPALTAFHNQDVLQQVTTALLPNQLAQQLLSFEHEPQQQSRTFEDYLFASAFVRQRPAFSFDDFFAAVDLLRNLASFKGLISEMRRDKGIAASIPAMRASINDLKSSYPKDTKFEGFFRSFGIDRTVEQWSRSAPQLTMSLRPRGF
ncbi:MAG: hypothetical protein A2103_02365 [Gammaproteobacteria bacterium GWF2_41_13]|nr:MAG: hypothetical protein A2103_02365 [Gammaproteobacteria bacterium GWF2_41_13]